MSTEEPLALDVLEAEGLLSALDVQLARRLSVLASEQSSEVLLAVALTSRQVRNGHVCLELPLLCEGKLGFEWPDLEQPRFPPYEGWRKALEQSVLFDARDPNAPLRIDARGRIYLQRYLEQERQVAIDLRRRAERKQKRVDEALLTDGLDRMFGAARPKPKRKHSGAEQAQLSLEIDAPAETAGTGRDDQRDAVAHAVRSAFTVITGGPGTGKTFTVVRLLALLVEQALARGERPPSLHLLAPTGKAAARLSESIATAKERLPCKPEVLAAIPSSASTVHRALAPTRRRSLVASELLAADVVVVDEASMVDLSLMASLLERIADESRLYLLGDRDQLASVEAGAVLGDVCRVTDDPRIAEHSPKLASSIVSLRRSRRYTEGGAIAQLAEAIKSGDADAVLATLRGAPRAELEWIAPPASLDPSSKALDPRLLAAATRGYAPLFGTGSPSVRLACLTRYRVLCAHRLGRFGAVSMNLEIERALRAEGHVKGSGTRYDGKPVMVVENDYDVQLYNGDVGILLRGESLRACFPAQDGQGLRELSIARIPRHETVYAMTVHKSQGSEAAEIAVVLPPEPSPIVSRELLYTAVTRAKERVVLYATEAALVAATQTAVRRSTGLLDALAGETYEPAST